MRIAVLTSSYPRYPGDSVAPFMQAICETLADLGHTVEVIAPADPAAPAIQDNGKVRVRRFSYIPFKRWQIMGHARALENDMRLRPLAFLLLPFFLISAFLALWQLTGRQKSQIIHAHWVLPNGLPAAWVARRRGIPLVISLHGSDVYLASRNRLFQLVAGRIFRQAALVTACSPELRDRALQLGAPANALLLPWGAFPEVFHPGLRARQEHSDRAPLVLVGLGRMVEKKGFHVLLQAMAEVVRAQPDIRLELAGDGPMREGLQKQAEALGLKEKVVFLGPLDWNAVPRFLAQGDVFVLPSVRDRQGNVDGLPTVLLEAMSCGLPVVASDIGGISLVVRDGENGRLVPPGDAHTLAQALLALLEDAEQRKLLGQAARQTVLQSFTWHQIMESFTKRVEELLPRQRTLAG